MEVVVTSVPTGLFVEVWLSAAGVTTTVGGARVCSPALPLTVGGRQGGTRAVWATGINVTSIKVPRSFLLVIP
jgi:hypothetical protein